MASVATARDHYVSAWEALERAGGLGTPAWLRPVRAAAIARVAERGFPTTRDEDWRYTNLAALVGVPFTPVTGPVPELPAGTLERFTLAPRDAGRPGVDAAGAPSFRLVFVDGRYSAGLSSIRPLPRGGRVSSLADALLTDGALVERYLARPDGGNGNVFAALNTAFLQDGALVYVAPDTGVEALIELLFLTVTPGSLAQPRTLIVAASGSRVAVLERHVGLTDGATFTNAATDVFAHPGAAVEHYVLQEQGGEAFHVATVQAVLEEAATLTTCGTSFGARLCRNTLGVRFAGPRARATLGGLYALDGRQHIDHHVTVDHAVPRCASRQLYKGILDGHARAVFNGRIVVRPDAQKTDASQTNKHLLLADGVEVDSKPQLEIFADDVRCTHGAAEGQLAAEPLFYLASRGLGEARARALLTYGFAREVIDTAPSAPVRALLDQTIMARLRMEPAPPRSQR